MRKDTYKIVYTDAGITKVLFCNILSEDDHFISLLAQDGTHFRLNKKDITSIKENKTHEADR